MKLTAEHLEYLDRSVLCWLATVSASGQPNVSPKEIFMAHGPDTIIIAQIASPNSVSNIHVNRHVTLCVVDVLVQKGFQFKGEAEVLDANHNAFIPMHASLDGMVHGKFPFREIIRIRLIGVKPILAPSYLFYPETNETDQVESARKQYGL